MQPRSVFTTVPTLNFINKDYIYLTTFEYKLGQLFIKDLSCRERLRRFCGLTVRDNLIVRRKPTCPS